MRLVTRIPLARCPASPASCTSPRFTLKGHRQAPTHSRPSERNQDAGHSTGERAASGQAHNSAASCCPSGDEARAHVLRGSVPESQLGRPSAPPGGHGSSCRRPANRRTAQVRGRALDSCPTTATAAPRVGTQTPPSGTAMVSLTWLHVRDHSQALGRMWWGAPALVPWARAVLDHIRLPQRHAPLQQVPRAGRGAALVGGPGRQEGPSQECLPRVSLRPSTPQRPLPRKTKGRAGGPWTDAQGRREIVGVQPTSSPCWDSRRVPAPRVQH